MITEIELPLELTKAAESLEKRLQILSVVTRKAPMAEWNAMPEPIHHLVPPWIPTLLSRFSLLGSVLECRHNVEDAAWPRLFCFWGPTQYVHRLSDCHFEFLSEGFVMISDEADGDFWLTSIAGGPSSPIYLWSLSGRERILASSRIALLMSSMGVAEESFFSFGKGQRPKSVMWHPA